MSFRALLRAYCLLMLFLFSLSFVVQAQAYSAAQQQEFANEPVPEALTASLGLLIAQKWDEAINSATEFLENGKTKNPIYISRAHHIIGQALLKQERWEAAYQHEFAAARFISLLDSCYYNRIPLLTEPFSEGCGIAFHLGLYQESINLGSAYWYIMRDIDDLSLPETRRLSEVILIAMRSYINLGKFYQALSFFNVAFKQIKPMDDDICDNYMFSMVALAGECCQNIDNRDYAITVFNMLVTLGLEKYGREDRRTCLAINSLASSLKEVSRYAEALDLYKDNISYIEKVLGKDSQEYVKVCSDYADTYYKLGEYGKAIDILKPLIENYEEKLTDKILLASMLSTLGLAQNALGNDDEGAESSKRSNEILCSIESNDVFFNDNVKTIEITNAIRNKDFISAQKGIDDLEKKLTLRNDSSSSLYYNILTHKCLLDLVLPNHSPEKYESLIHAAERIFGNNSEETLQALTLAYHYYLITSNRQGIEDVSNKSISVLSSLLTQNFIILNASQRASFWEKHKNLLTLLVPLSLKISPSEENILNAYKAALISKGLLINTDTSLAEIDQEAGTEEHYSIKVNNMQKELVEKIKTVNDEVESLALWDEVNKISPRCANLQKKLIIGPEDVFSSMKPGDMAVEFVWVDNNTNGFLMAYVFCHGWKKPKAKILMNKSQWEELNKNEIYTSSALSKFIWGYLAEYAQGIKNIYFAPDGPLYNIAIESIPDYEDPSKSISSRWNLYRLSSTRELALKNKNKNNKEAAVFGGMKYDASPSVDNVASGRGICSYEIGDMFLDDTGLRGGVGYLPETLNEANKLGELLDKAKIKYSKYIGEAAAESNFKALSGKTLRIVHVATHGFYWTMKDIRRNASLSFLSIDDEGATQEDYALSRSGLLFSGANTVLSGKNLPQGVDDGVLTALEIASLNLDGLDLLVLSACETGLGDITSDGVFGLQRGFKKAGVNSIMMSLWKVDDRATQMLMSKFYEYYLAGNSKRQSLLLAQKYVREYEETGEASMENNASDEELTENQRRRLMKNNTYNNSSREGIQIVHPYENPKYWAAFILLDAID